MRQFTSQDKLEAICAVAKAMPDPLLLRARDVVEWANACHRADTLLRADDLPDPDLQRWLTESLADARLVGLGATADELLSAVVPRLRALVASDAARNGAAAASSRAILWPGREMVHERLVSQVASMEELSSIGAVLAKDRLSAGPPPYEDQIWLLSRDEGALTAGLDPPFYWRYFGFAEHFSARLAPSLADELAFVDAVGELDAVLALLHPLAVYRYLERWQADRAFLLARLSAKNDCIAGAALRLLVERLAWTPQVARREAAEVQYKLAHNTADSAQEFEQLKSTVTSAEEEADALVREIEVRIGPEVARFAQCLLSAGSIRPANERARKLAIRLLSRLPDNDLDSVVAAELLKAREPGNWSGMLLLADAAAATDRWRIVRRIADAAVGAFIETGSEASSLVSAPLGLLVESYIAILGRDSAQFDADLRDVCDRALDAWSERYVHETCAVLQQAALRSLAALVGFERNPVVRAESWGQAVSWLIQIVALAHRWTPDLVGEAAQVAVRLSSSLTVPSPLLLDLFVAAARSEHYLYIWPTWLPGESTARAALLSASHDAVLHEQAEFLASTCRDAGECSYLLAALLDTDCRACHEVACRRLANSPESPRVRRPRPLSGCAKLVLSRRGDCAVVASLLALPVEHPGLQRLRDVLARRATEAVGCALEPMLEVAAPIREMEALHMLDRSDVLFDDIGR